MEGKSVGLSPSSSSCREADVWCEEAERVGGPEAQMCLQERQRPSPQQASSTPTDNTAAQGLPSKAAPFPLGDRWGE